MIASGHDTATQRYHNALALFDEYVRATVSDPDAATLRGLERRFAERLEIQPSYWSQIKSRSRQIGERLARQFEQRCGKPAGWMDKAHGMPPRAATTTVPSASTVNKPLNSPALSVPTLTTVDATPRDEDERFIVGLVLSYYRRHPQKARQRLLDLLGEMLVTPPVAPPSAPVARPAVSDDAALWLKTQQGVAPLKAKTTKAQR